MGNLRVMKTITVDVMLANRAKQEGINLSRTMDRALEAMFQQTDAMDGPTPEQLAQRAEEARNLKVGEALTATLSNLSKEKEIALQELQHGWNLYMASGPKPIEKALAWVKAHRERHPALRTMTPEGIFEELAGHPP